MQLLYALACGVSVGMLFGWLKLPLPAPPTLTGIVGAAGVFLGSVIINVIRARLAG
ncbi:XapX domain-containing protein [Martelella alba]|uniref:DUF1427 family protein n=1 Tax=Martelella alba TaxID=2590451 RepID=A0ABY2SKK7_9HYPH|nr:XapX domain-containing protein [Martelella alba]TKI06111.1 DUF1427 family protein [Martelella alba]